MSNRTGLAAKVPTLELNTEMYSMPDLIDAFDCCFYSMTVNGNIHPRSKECGSRHNRGQVPCVPAPDVQEMLEWLSKHQSPEQSFALYSIEPDTDHPAYENEYDVKDPDALARACLEAAK